MSISKEQWREINDAVCRGRLYSKMKFDDLDYYHKMFYGAYYDNDNLKGKKMTNVFEILAIQTHTDMNPLPTVVVPITTVVAENEQIAVQNFLIDNASTLKGKENVETKCRPFC